MSNTARVAAAISHSESSYSQSHLHSDPVEFPTTTDVDLPVCEEHGPHTPMRPSTHRTGAPMQTVLEVKKQLKRELHIGGEISVENIKASSIFARVPGIDRQQITDYLTKTKLYNSTSKRWQDIPDAVKKEEKLYAPFEAIIRDILQYFDNFGDVSVRDTHKTRLTSLEEYHMKFVNEKGNEVLAKTSPDLCVMGKGRWFKDKHNDTPSYFFCVAPVELKTEKLYNNVGFHEVMLQIAVYARQCFNHQPNRRFVCSIMATEKNFRLLIFDRLGVMWTPEFNIHVDAAAFVRTILGISSIASKTLSCFDTDIEWLPCKKCVHQYLRIAPSGMKAVAVTERNAGTGANAASGAEKETMLTIDEKSIRNLKIVVNSKPFIRKAIRGRGTRCWYGITEDASHIGVVVKESWRSKDRKPESDLLKRVAHLDGVGKMLYFSDSRADAVSKFRSLIFSDGVQDGGFDRYFSRVVLEAYGPPIHYFKSPLQLLSALRDAVAGHRFMWEQGILHRDISVHNIVLGKADASDGNRGVLIDMDMAIDVGDKKRTNTVEPRTGTRAFQSVMVLKPLDEGEVRPPQDHLDDLESFFYVLMWIGMLFVESGKMRAQVTDPIIVQMEDPSDRACMNNKLSMLTLPTQALTPWFKHSPVFITLVRNLGPNLLFPKVSAKIDKQLELQSKPGTEFPLLAAVHEAADRTKGHDAFLGHLDDAINTIRANPSQGPNPDLHRYHGEVRHLDLAAGEAPLADSATSYGLMETAAKRGREDGPSPKDGAPETSATDDLKRLRIRP